MIAVGFPQKSPQIFRTPQNPQNIMQTFSELELCHSLIGILLLAAIRWSEMSPAHPRKRCFHAAFVVSIALINLGPQATPLHRGVNPGKSSAPASQAKIKTPPNRFLRQFRVGEIAGAVRHTGSLAADT